jgi:peptidoglycan hydrolase-like protein with peptidoglycan-binding domain
MDPWVKNTQQWINSTYSQKGISGVGPVAVDGQTGWETMYALTRALQHELKIATLSDTFGPGTLAALTKLGPVDGSTKNKNILRIAQGAMYCKGYNGGDGALDAQWDSVVIASVKKLHTHIGLAAGGGAIEPKVFKALLNLDSFLLLSGGNSVVQSIQRSLNARYINRSDFFLVAADGFYSRDTQRALMFAIQYEVGLADGVANGNFGPATKAGLKTYGGLKQGSTDSSRYLVHLFQAALRFNGYTTTYDGTYSADTKAKTASFQEFVGLPVTGNAHVETWGSLLVSTGDPDRPGTGADCVTTLSDDRLATLRAAGYQYFGRYLTNTPDSVPDKCLKAGEAERIVSAGGHLFPIFQTGGSVPSHFTNARGKDVAEEATEAAWWYRIPNGTIIYFTVDYDAQDYEVTDSIIPYFQGVNERISSFYGEYRVGVYGPRNVCTRLQEAGLTVSSFVSDMSTGYQGNLAQRLPTNWAFDQVQTLTVGSGTAAVEIDKNIASGRNTAVTALTSAKGMGDDPAIPAARFDHFWDECFQACYRYPDTAAQQAIMLLNQSDTKARVQNHDGYITQLAAKYNVHKALVLTVMIWESLCINVTDDGRDAQVTAYYAAVLAGKEPPVGSIRDSSTGICQIFAETGIAARNWARSLGYLSDRVYDFEKPEDAWEIWLNLRDNQEFALETALFTLMREAELKESVKPTLVGDMTPSQVQRTFQGYNNGLIYGRNRTHLYYTIMRLEESFR